MRGASSRKIRSCTKEIRWREGKKSRRNPEIRRGVFYLATVRVPGTCSWERSFQWNERIKTEKDRVSLDNLLSILEAELKFGLEEGSIDSVPIVCCTTVFSYFGNRIELIRTAGSEPVCRSWTDLEDSELPSDLTP